MMTALTLTALTAAAGQARNEVGPAIALVLSILLLLFMWLLARSHE